MPPPDPNPSRKYLVNNIVIAVLLTVGLISILIYTDVTESKTKVTLNIGDNSVDLELDNSELQAVEILNLLFKEENRKRETQALLKEFYDVYYVEDPQLVDELAVVSGDARISIELRQLLKELRGPFHRKFHKFYDIEDKSIINAIEKLGFVADTGIGNRAAVHDNRLIRGVEEYVIGDLVVHAKGPFKEVARPMRFSVPSGNKISEGKGASCRSNPYFRKKIRIFDQTKTRSADILVEYPFDCPVSSSDEESELIDLIQISYTDMKNLIGDSPVPKFEPGYAKSN